LAALYRDADAVLFPVRWQEPFGLVPLEAMACGTPVVATGTGGSAEYLVDEGNALMVAPDDPAALARAVRRMASDPALRARLRRHGLVTSAGHDRRRSSAELERLLVELAAVGARSRRWANGREGEEGAG
jgi:glycosyltransferase involved in cell wall biosynthesis